MNVILVKIFCMLKPCILNQRRLPDQVGILHNRC